MLVGLNPIVLVWGLGGDHNDFLMVFCIVLGFYLLLRAHGDVASGRRPQQAARRADGSLPPSPALIGAGAAFVVAAGAQGLGAAC